MTATLQRESTEYVYVGVNGDIPSDGAEAAFLDSGVRPTTEWSTAVIVDSDAHALWADAVAAVGAHDYFVAHKIGTFQVGGIDLDPGTYTMWVRLTNSDERPVLIAPQDVVIQ